MKIFKKKDLFFLPQNNKMKERNNKEEDGLIRNGRETVNCNNK